MRRFSKTPAYALILLAVILAGCGGKGAPPAAEDLVGTMVAGTYQALTAAPQATATLEPPAAPAATAAPPTRLDFEAGATSALAGVDLQPGQSQSYVVSAMQGQPLMAQVDSPDSDGSLAVRGADNVELLSAALGESAWRGILPTTQDYIITVTAGPAGGAYDLEITVAARIPGTATGATVGGRNISYAAWVPAGQTITVTLHTAPGAACIEVWGMSDGQVYVSRAENWTTFFITPGVGQDFIIDVYPNNGQVVDFTLAVDIR